MKHIKLIFLLINLVPVFLTHEGQAQNGSFDIDGKSQLVLVNNTNGSIGIQSRNFTIWPYKDIRLKKEIPPNDQLSLELSTQGKDYVILNINNFTYYLFSQPGSYDTISINSEAKKLQRISFSGHSKGINEYKAQKARHFSSNSVDFMGRSASYTDSINSYERIAAINDSITNVNLEYLQANSGNLPKWYVNFETDRMEYLSARHKINSILHRKLFQNLEDPVPTNFFQMVKSTIKVENQVMLGNSTYMSFLNDYFNYLNEFPFERVVHSRNEKRKNLINQIKNQLSGLVRDAYLSEVFCRSIDNGVSFDVASMDLVENDMFNSFLKKYSVTYSVLPTGADIPYFYLPDTSGLYHEPTHFKNRIVLINFWNAGCKPCIMDFPHENELVKRYKKEPVTILNISTSSRLWKKMIAKHELQTVNLLAEGKWGEKLWNEFDINGLPHSALIDWNGKIIQNKCPRASSNIDELIDGLLIQMKRAHD